MKNKFRFFALLIFSLILAGSTLAKFCLECSRLAYIQAIGECPQCKGFTRSARHKLCGKCSTKENKCQNCLLALDADTGKKPQKVLKGPSGKPYPAHWGAPPLNQTGDLCPLPAGYGRGSSTLGRWIQENLDKDAFKKALADAIPGLEIKKAMFGNTILHVTMPNSVNAVQAMAKLKAVKSVKYIELNGRVGIQPALRQRPIQIRPRPQPIQIQPTPPAVQIQSVPRPELVASPRPPELVAPPVFRPGGGGPVDKAKVAQFKKSLNAWEKLKVECGGNYTYSKHWSSWVGFGHMTEVVVVENNKVVERRDKSFSGRPRPVAQGQPPAKPEGTSWTEKGNELGKNKQGHPAKKLDDRYKEAAEILGRLVPPFQRLGLRFDKQGLLLACYTQGTRIADDAPTKEGSISSITLQNPGNHQNLYKQLKYWHSKSKH
jgi:hypothetical protein